MNNYTDSRPQSQVLFGIKPAVNGVAAIVQGCMCRRSRVSINMWVFLFAIGGAV